MLLLVVALLGAAALVAPQAMAGTPGSITVVPSSTNTGSAVIQGFNLNNCSINGQASFGDCTAENISGGSQYILTATVTGGSTFIGFVNCPGVQSPPNPATGGTCTFNTTAVGGNDITIGVTTTLARTLTIVKSGTGTGLVTSSPSGISCGSACTASFVPPLTVTLTAFPSSGSAFGGWGGACLAFGTNPTCTITMTTTTTVTATFTARPTFTFTVSTAGAGSGTVTSTPAGLNCPPTCTAAVVGGTTVTLTPNPAAGSEFGGWSGSCTGTGPCTITVNAAAAVTATFNRAAVEAAVAGTFFTRNGPRVARRVLNVNIGADEQVRVNMRIVRSGIVLASKVLTSFAAGDRTVRFPVRNGIAAGRAQLQITFTDLFGNTKNQTRRIRIPTL